MSVKEYISEERIKTRVKEIGAEINKDYAGEEIVIIGILNGAIMFCADLIREIKLPLRLEMMSVSSYGDSTESSGELDIRLDIKKSIKDKHVIIVEDIVDTGLTMTCLIERLKKLGPKSLKVSTLLYKPARSKHDVKIDYLAFEVEDKFVLGYGLDAMGGFYRNLPFIGVYES